MNQPEKRSFILQCLQDDELWDSEANIFKIKLSRDIINIKSSTQNHSYQVNLQLKVEFLKQELIYYGIVIDGNLYKANHKDLLNLRKLISARVTFLSIQNEYFINLKISEGGKAEGVYEALSKEANEVRAIKQYDKSKRSVKQIHKEIQITQKFEYKNVVQIYEVYESEASIYIVYEKLKVFKTYKYTVEQKYNFIYDLLNVLQLMHFRQYMHRDIKLSNLMIGNNNQIKLIGFGLATKCKKQHKPSGTPGYMAPEIFTTREYDEKCDIYSLGIVIYEMFTNEKLYGGLKIKDVINSNYIEPFNTEQLTKIPKELQDLTKFMLISDPNLRISAKIAKNLNIFIKNFDNSVMTDVTVMESQKQHQK